MNQMTGTAARPPDRGEVVRDFLALVGFVALGVGVWYGWGWPMALIVTGSVLILESWRGR